jgi:enoyl-CoA hydratase
VAVYEHVLYAAKDRVATITLNRPTVLNALNERMMGELEAVLAEAAADNGVAALILTGAGDKAFVAGADIQELSKHSSASGREAALYGQAVFGLLETMGKPSIAAINGFALGGGCELALACTVRLASRTAKLGQPEVKLGLLPGYGGTQRLARLCGPGFAQELCLSGEMISAEEALRIGLVNHVYEPHELMPAAHMLAQKFAANAPVAMRLAMEAIRRGLQMPLEEGLALEATLFAMCCGTEDMAEGTRAFLEKRPAKFQGR